MTDDKIAAIIAHFGSNLTDSDKLALRSQLMTASDAKYSLVMSTPVKSTTTTLILSIFLGGLGIDRFYLGDTGLGVCKLLFGWLTFYIWPFIDIFVTYKRAKEINMKNILATLG